ncbi:MAG: GNAT family protein [Bacteroidota bacterium]
MIAQLSTTRLVLKPWTSTELNALFAAHSKAEIMQALGYTTDKEYESQLKKYKDQYDLGKRPFINFQLILKDTHETIGYCGFHNWVKEHFRAEIGYHMLSDRYKQKGLMHEALQCILHYGFDELKLHRVEACTASDNKASIALLHKCGFQQEGLMRQHYYMDNLFYDSVLFSLMRDEFNTL